MSLVRVWDDVYSSEELEAIWSCLDEIETWDGEREVGSSSFKESGELKRSGKARWIMDSDPLGEFTDKLFSAGYTGSYAEDGLWESGILLTNSHQNLLSYYEDGDKYLSHWDASPYTALTWICKEPQRFTGGDLYFGQLDQLVPFRNNRMVIFPGQVWHEVTPVSLPAEHHGKNLGRYCISQFLNIDSQLHAKEAK